MLLHARLECATIDVPHLKMDFESYPFSWPAVGSRGPRCGTP